MDEDAPDLCSPHLDTGLTLLLGSLKRGQDLRAAVGSQDPGPDTCPPCGEVAPFAEGSRHRETQPCAAEFVASHASRTLHRHLQDLPPSGTRAAVLEAEREMARYARFWRPS